MQVEGPIEGGEDKEVVEPETQEGPILSVNAVEDSQGYETIKRC